MSTTQVRDNPDVIVIEKAVGEANGPQTDFYKALVAVIRQASVSQYGIGLSADKPIDQARYGVPGHKLRDYFAHPTPESPAHTDEHVRQVVRFIDLLPHQVGEQLRRNISHLLADVTATSYGTGLGDVLVLYDKRPSFQPDITGADFIRYFEANASALEPKR